MNVNVLRALGKRFLLALGATAAVAASSVVLAASPASASVALCTPQDAVYQQIPHTDYSWKLQFQYDILDGISGYTYSSWIDYTGSQVSGVAAAATVTQTDNSTPPTAPAQGTYTVDPSVYVPYDEAHPGTTTTVKFQYVSTGSNAYTVQGDLISAPIYCEWYTWDVHGYYPGATGAGSVPWPQSLVGQGQIAPEDCGVTYQQDLYRGTREAIDAVVGDGILTYVGQPEDHALVKSWVYVSSNECGAQDNFFTTDPEVWGAPTCEDSTVHGTQTVHHWKYVWNPDTHVFDVVADGPDTVTNVTRPATEEELAGLICVTDVTLDTSSTPDVTEVTLAATGAGGTSGGAALALAFALGGLGLLLLRRRAAEEI